MSNPNLDLEIDRLQIQADRLHSKIMATGRNITSAIKRKYQDEEADILHEITILRDKKEALQEAEALEKINDLFRASEYVIIIEINAMRTKPDQDLNIELKFSCGHTRKIHMSEMLSYQKSIKNPQVLLAKWNAILSSQTALTTRFSCEECKRAKAEKFARFRRHSPTDVIGTCTMDMRVI